MFLIPFGPTPGQQFPFRLEISAELTAELRAQGSEEYGNGIVAWGLGEGAVGGVGEFERGGFGEGGGEAVFGGVLFGGEGEGEEEEEGGEEGWQETHVGGGGSRDPIPREDDDSLNGLKLLR